MPEHSTQIEPTSNPDTIQPTTDLAKELAEAQQLVRIYRDTILSQRQLLEDENELKQRKDEEIALRDQLIHEINAMYASVPQILGFNSLKELYEAGGGALAAKVTKMLPSLVTGKKIKGSDEVGKHLKRSQELFTEIYGENALLLNPSNTTQIKKIS